MDSVSERPDDTNPANAEDREANLSEETRNLARMGRGEDVSTTDPDAGDDTADDRPEWLPEKFKSPEDLLKSYSELEKKLGANKADDGAEDEETPLKVSKKKAKADDADSDDDAADEGGDDEDGDDDLPDFSSETVQTAMSDVASLYAESGELTDDMRKTLNDVGIPDDLIDTHMRGVKAQEKAMRQEVFSLAGSEEDYSAAVAWAAENWSEEEIEAFDQGLEKDKLRPKIVKGLMDEYRAANPGEGKLTTVRGGSDRGSVYHSHAEFQQDLAKAGENQVEREKVIDKLRRSRKAGTIKSAQSASPFNL